MDFGRWLLNQTYRNDCVGVLATSYFEDIEYHKLTNEPSSYPTGSNLRLWEKYLKGKEVSHYLLVAYKEWESTLIKTKDEDGLRKRS